jgi:hypothetical protein
MAASRPTEVSVKTFALLTAGVVLVIVEAILLFRLFRRVAGSFGRGPGLALGLLILI